MSSVTPYMWTREYKALAHWVIDRDQHTCMINGPRCTHRATQADHIVARADGGADTPENMRAACAQCNAWRAATRTNAMRYQQAVAHYETRM